jgi:hypothetical protein
MDLQLTTGLELFASRAWEAPVSAQTKILNQRRKILHVGTGIPKLAAAVVVLPILSLALLVLILISAPLARLSTALNRYVIKMFRYQLGRGDVSQLRKIAEAIALQLPRLRELRSADSELRGKSEFYNWYLSGFQEDLDGFVADYEDILEAIEIGLDPKWRDRLADSKVAARVA